MASPLLPSVLAFGSCYLMYTIRYLILFDLFFTVVHASYLSFFASLLLCFLGWLCCKLQILRPHLLPIVRNKWICICSRKHLAGFRQRQLPLSTSCLFLPFLAPFRIISIISSIYQVYIKISSQHISCTNQWLPFFFQTILRWNLFHTGGTCRTFSLAPEVLLGFIPSHTFSHHQAHACMMLVKRGDVAQLQGFQCLFWWFLLALPVKHILHNIYLYHVNV